MPEFTMNGYKDIRGVSDEVRERYGDRLDIRNATVAAVAQVLLARVQHLKDRRDQGMELFLGVSGIVQCAIEDHLIDDAER